MKSLPKIASIDPARRAASLTDEFKKFAFKGNVIIGGVFAREGGGRGRPYQRPGTAYGNS